eukprot:UN14905
MFLLGATQKFQKHLAEKISSQTRPVRSRAQSHFI